MVPDIGLDCRAIHVKSGDMAGRGGCLRVCLKAPGMASTAASSGPFGTSRRHRFRALGPRFMLLLAVLFLAGSGIGIAEASRDSSRTKPAGGQTDPVADRIL